MSLYNMMHGVDPNAPALLYALNIDHKTVERIRDVSFVKVADEYLIDIFTRTGGNNRESFPNDLLKGHPLYVRDEDDSFDNTYAHFYFKIPCRIYTMLKEQGMTIEEVVDPHSFKEKHDEVLAALSKGF